MLGKEIERGDIIQGWRTYSIQQARAFARNEPHNTVILLRLERITPGELVPHRETKPAWYWADEEVL